MRRFFGTIGVSVFALVVVLKCGLVLGRQVGELTTYRLDSINGLELVNTAAQIMNYRGRRS